MKVRETRKKLVGAALSLFAEHGFDATSVGEIEAAAGLSRRAGGFYRHFESKAAILAAVLDENIIETPKNIGVEDLLPLGDTRAELVLLARAYLRINERNRQLARIVEREVDRNAQLRARLTQANADLLESLSTWLGTKPAAAGADADKLQALTGIVFGGWLFVLSKHLQRTLPDDFDLDDYLSLWATLWATQLESKGALGSNALSSDAAMT